MSIIVFDTETTGLPKSKDINISQQHLWPHIVQFSYIIYDLGSFNILKTRDHIINLSSEITIPDECVKIHNITNDMAHCSDVYLKDVLKEFMNDVIQTNIVIGHNISFDLNMIKIELLRLIDKTKNSEFKKMLFYIQNTDKLYCTMKSMVDTCRIERKRKNGSIYFKYPSLSELHEHLFAVIPNKLHNSLMDILITLRCFIKIKTRRDLLCVSDDYKLMVADCFR